MKIKIDLDNDTGDNLVRDILKFHLDVVAENITRLKKKKNLAAYQKEDLADNVQLFDAMKKTHNYFTG